jgi:hypothetical protein
MIHVSAALETRVCAFETCESSYIGRPAMPFLIHKARDPLETIGHVEAPVPSLPGRRGLEL